MTMHNAIFKMCKQPGNMKNQNKKAQMYITSDMVENVIVPKNIANWNWNCIPFLWNGIPIFIFQKRTKQNANKFTACI